MDPTRLLSRAGLAFYQQSNSGERAGYGVCVRMACESERRILATLIGSFVRLRQRVADVMVFIRGSSEVQHRFSFVEDGRSLLLCCAFQVAIRLAGYSG